MRALSSLLLISIAGTTVCFGSAGTVQVDWTEFGHRAVGRRIAVQLPEGCEVQANVVRVEPGSVNVTVRSTSDPVRCPKGFRKIPREAFSTVRVIGGGSAIRTGFAILGGIGGFATSVLATFAVKGDEWGGGGGDVALWTTSATAGAVGGFCLSG